MRLSEIYIKEVMLSEFWDGIEKDLSEEFISEDRNGLDTFLSEAKPLIFEKFDINPSSKEYVIVGSARLHLFQPLSDAFGLTGSIGDLDIVIHPKIWNAKVLPKMNEEIGKELIKQNPEKIGDAPNIENLILKIIENPTNAEKLGVVIDDNTLNKITLLTQGIYRPTNTVEAFNAWDPKKSDPKKYANTNISSTDEIFAKSNAVDGYNFMSLGHIMEYKTQLSRDKEQKVVNLMNQYGENKIKDKEGTIMDKRGFLKQLIRLIGLDATKQFINYVKPSSK